MNSTTRILTAIPSTEPCTFNELLRALGDDAPGPSEYREFFQTLEMFEDSELVDIERTNGRIDSLQLTPLGAERAREALRGADR